MIYVGEQMSPEENFSNTDGEMTSIGLSTTSSELLGSIAAKVVYYREFPADLDPCATHDASGNRIIVIE